MLAMPLGFLIGPAVHGGTEIELELGRALSNPARRRMDGYAVRFLTGRTLVPQGKSEYRDFTDIRHSEVVFDICMVCASTVERRIKSVLQWILKTRRTW